LALPEFFLDLNLLEIRGENFEKGFPKFFGSKIPDEIFLASQIIIKL